MDSGRRPLVSVIVVTWNSAATIPELLKGLEDQSPDVDLEVIVVDNASSDATRSLLSQAPTWVRVIPNSGNRGLSAANNQGLLAASAPDYLVICNPDTKAGPGCFAAMIEVADRHPNAGVVIPRIVGVDGAPHVSVGAIPTVTTALLGRRAGRWLSVRRPEREGDLWWDDWPHDTESEIPRGAEACYLLRRQAVAAVGLQDERYPLDWEGIDWADRFRSAGWQIWFTPLAVVAHRGGASIRQAQLHWIVASHRGLAQFCRDRVAAPLRPAVTVAVALRAATKLALVFSGRDAYAAAQEIMAGDS